MAIYRGTASADYITGFAAGDILIGLGGNDVFTSHASWCEAEGGLGDDLYAVSDLRVVIREYARGGNDTVWFSRIGSYTLPDEVKNLAPASISMATRWRISRW